MEDQLKNIPTIVLSELPQAEREKYFKFLLENEVQFVEDNFGYYTALIKVVNSKGKIYKEMQSQLKTEKSRIMDSTFSYKQKMVITESPRSTTPNSLNRSLRQSKDSKSKSPNRRPKSPIDYSPSRIKGITDLLENDNLKSNSGLNTSRTSAKTPEKLREDPLKIFLQTTKFQEFFRIAKVQTSSHLRPKTLSVTVLMKTIEEIYSARYKKETTQSEEKLKKNENESNGSFPEFVYEFFNEKFKNKRMVDQNALDLCQSVETYDTEFIEIQIFSQFLTQNYPSEILLFFLYVRSTIASVFNIQLIPSKVYSEFSGQKIQDTRTITFTYKQCIKIASIVYAEEESLQKAFISELEHNFKEATLKFYDFLQMFIENYKNSSQEIHDHSLSPFNSDKQNETFGDSLMHTDSELMKSVNMSPAHLLNQAKQSKESLNESRPLPKGPFEKIKDLCIEHCENKLVHQFISIILSGYLDDYDENKDEIIQYVENIVLEKMSGLIEAVCRCDKRKWMEILESDSKECLRYCENLQKKLREIQKKGNQAGSDDIDQICKEILQTPELKLFISEKIKEICQN